MIEPERLKVLSLKSYDHILYEACDGRLFLTVSLEKGFASCHSTVELNEIEVIQARESFQSLLESLKRDFEGNYKNFIDDRGIIGFSNWKAARLAVENWRRP